MALPGAAVELRAHVIIEAGALTFLIKIKAPRRDGVTLCLNRLQDFSAAFERQVVAYHEINHPSWQG
ncbi:hypothetical protein KMS_R26150 [Pseudomonas sp. LRP2-20]|uniref:hypothetical protein n=1 Tax=Pseudomonas sp. LRP2-20 TaxID=2944234 RepID=UPI00218A236B|nr:hypothetical protein [Pseudomonas sp. LRP2-20]BDM22858.1 hypothetical protein KMS_R26150 [Pseudomonas sp. LRP2-20]